MIKENTKFLPSCIFEGMTSIRAVIKANDLNISNRHIEKILLDKEKTRKNSKEIGYFKAVSQKYGFEIEITDARVLDEISLGNTHGGIIAVCTDRKIPSLTSDFIENQNGFYCMIEGIEDPYNFGYALRSLYACGCDGIILTERNWMSSAGVVCRSSAGASEMFKLATANPQDTAILFKNHGFRVVCADENTDDILGQTSLPLPLLLIVGGEKRGISKSTLDLADKLVKINYAREFKASLSAASATTMFAYEIMRQNTKK